MKALQIGGSWRATFSALSAQLALLTGAWLAPAGMAMDVTRGHQYGGGLFLLGLSLLTVPLFGCGR